MRVRTKIFATLGPASTAASELRKMMVQGLDGVRLNFSHGTHEEHRARVRTVRELNRKMRRAVKIMQDLEGYRIRVGRLEAPMEIKRGGFYEFVQAEEAEAPAIAFDYRGSLRGIRRGAEIYIDDGRLVFEVQGAVRGKIRARARVAGLLKAHKGINIPGASLEFEALTAKDRRDVEIAIDEKLDFVAQSFVRNACDIRLLRDLLKSRHCRCRIFAKIENREALGAIDEIIGEADGIIVARGDLGICVPIYKVPVIQKEIVKRCLLEKKPVMVATQMLDSMTESLLPTRAEVSDVANALWDGATHLLLSGETAVGKHPARVVEMMNQIIKHTEASQSRVRMLLTP